MKEPKCPECGKEELSFIEYEMRLYTFTDLEGGDAGDEVCSFEDEGFIFDYENNEPCDDKKYPNEVYCASCGTTWEYKAFVKEYRGELVVEDKPVEDMDEHGDDLITCPMCDTVLKRSELRSAMFCYNCGYDIISS